MSHVASPSQLLTRSRQIWLLLLIAFSCVILGNSQRAFAEPADVSQLLPEETLLYVRLSSGKDLADRFEASSLGRMKNDPRVKPLIEALLGTADEALTSVEEQVGMKPLEALRMLEGSLSVAIVSQDKARPAPVLLMDMPEDTQKLEQLLAKAEAAMVESGATKSTEEIDGITATIFELPRGRRAQIVWLKMEGRMLFCEGLPTAKLMLGRASATPETSLASNPQYAAIMNRCRVGESAEPQVAVFVDPIGMAKGYASGNPQVQLGLAFLPASGLDGLKAIGGTWTMATESFDQIIQAHLLLDNPRAGAVKMLALRSGECEPEAWVPAEVASYSTFRWDVRTTYDTLGTLFDSFQGAGSFAGMVQQRVSEQIDADFEADILAALDGRVSLLSIFEQPASLSSRGSLWAVHLKDGEAFKATFDKLMANERFQLEEKEIGGQKYYAGPARRRRGELDPDENAPRPAIMLMGNVLFGADRSSMLNAVILAQQKSSSLAGALDYKLVASRLGRQPGGDKPVMVSFSRPEVAMTNWLEMASSPDSLQSLERAAERSPVARSLHEIITSGKLPPAAVLKEYLAPAGALITDDETGFHYTGFSLKRK